MEYPILLKLYNNINTDHLGRTSRPTPHRTVNFDNLHNTVSIPDSPLIESNSFISFVSGNSLFHHFLITNMIK